MKSKCDHCPIREGCDWLSELCRLSASELPRVRPDLIRTLTKHQRYYYANKDKYREWNRAARRRYLANNRAKRLETERNWRAKHKASVSATQRAWWDRNKDKINAARRAARAAAKV